MHTILIIEDEPAIAEVLAEMCGALVCRTVRATTLEEVRVRIEEGGFCSVLLDLHPGRRPRTRARRGR